MHCVIIEAQLWTQFDPDQRIIYSWIIIYFSQGSVHCYATNNCNQPPSYFWLYVLLSSNRYISSFECVVVSPTLSLLGISSSVIYRRSSMIRTSIYFLNPHIIGNLKKSLSWHIDTFYLMEWRTGIFWLSGTLFGPRQSFQ